MQDQPQEPVKVGDARRARQAARASDDVFKGGTGTTGRRDGGLRMPWHTGAGRLWEAVRNRTTALAED